MLESWLRLCHPAELLRHSAELLHHSAELPRHPVEPFMIFYNQANNLRQYIDMYLRQCD